jgi:ArsR family transcriptional regulator
MNEEIIIFSEEQIKFARFAKAMGHPVRMYILELLSKQSCIYLKASQKNTKQLLA